MTKDEALTLEALKYAASMGYGRIVREMKIAPFTIKCDAPAAQPPLPVQDGKCKYCTAGCPACDARKLPAQEPHNFCPRCGKRAQGVLGQPQIHTCTPPLWGYK